MSKLKKTNAMRILDSKNISYKTHTYETENGFNDGISVALKIFKDTILIYKTLVAESSAREIYVFIIPVASELDLKKAASVTGDKKIEMVPVKKIFELTGYIRGGCSPVGMKKHYKAFIDSSAEDIDNIIVSGGKIGLQLELSVKDLMSLTDAYVSDLIKTGQIVN